MSFVISAPPVHTLAVAGEPGLFPVNRVFCIGRNYAAHAREMGKDPDREPPFFFMKPANAVVQAGESEMAIPYPPMTGNFHHEIELVIAIGKGGSDIDADRALEHVYGYAVGLDMTRRDLQLEARDKGRPWEFGKSFSKSAPIGPLYRAADAGAVAEADIRLTVNGEVRQSSNIAKLIWSVQESIAYLSKYESLEPGDLIMTGTPEGVGAVVRGDLMEGAIDGLGRIVVRVAA
ncbi:fumarylacetoacetate hydrolase family protein [Trinickia terrae]|uniref:Fumarylacetoacetate hydrolase family protein n=1 Tax=Trinickia terrae TaxID=2571161 RepID=A0A4U1I3U2_9BURK|nr:fumarylacetoacetate hydrolase family protein [Trinickia terrae]TKC87919.1 fumarylacetoacetate hydrolase family protein [Trinickia terrae]